MFNIGDKVVYPMHGAGVIVAIENREILGEIRKYYILKMPINDMKVMVPVEGVGDSGVRDILEKEDMDRVLEVLSTYKDDTMPKNWNRRYRYNMERIKSGDIIEIAKVVRALEILDHRKNLSTGERKMLSQAKRIVVSEMVLVYEKDLEEVLKMVEERVLQG